MTIKKKKTMAKNITQKEYTQILANIKQQISHAQLKATFAVNKELLTLYWNLGKTIVQLQKEQGWGSKIIEKLRTDIQ